MFWQSLMKSVLGDPPSAIVKGNLFRGGNNISSMGYSRIASWETQIRPPHWNRKTKGRTNLKLEEATFGC